MGTPKGPQKITPKDIVILYGRVSALEELDRRQLDTRREQAHVEAVEEQAIISRKVEENIENKPALEKETP